MSVPLVIFALGGLCLLVAATVFVAVAWGQLGLTGRTLVMTGLTLLFVVAALVVTRRRLRGASETLWVIALAMLIIDLVAGHAAGFPGLGGLSARGTAEVTGVVIAVAGAAASAYAGRRLQAPLVGGQVLAGFGLLAATAAGPWTAGHAGVATLLTIPVLLLLGAGSRRADLQGVAGTAAGLAAVSWLILIGDGLGRAYASATVWYLHVFGWPLLAAAALAGAASFVRRLEGHRVPESVRAGAAGACLVCVGLFALLGIHRPVPLLVGVCIAVVVLAGIAVAAPRVWSIPAVSLAGVAAIGLLLLLVTAPLRLLVHSRADATLRLSAHLHPVHEFAAWVWPVVAVAVVLAAFAGLRYVPENERPFVRRALTGTAPTLVFLGVAALLVRTDPPAWLAALAYLVALLVALAASTRMREPATMAPAGVAVVIAAGSLLRVAIVSETLLAITLTAIALLAAGTHLALRRWAGVAATYLGVAALAGAAALALWLDEAHEPRGVVAVALAAYAGGCLLAAQFAGKGSVTRRVVEVCAAAPGLVALLMSASPANAEVVLTVLGAACCLVAIWRTDREALRWAGSALLLTATLIRWIEHVAFPELVTLPAAVVLLAAGSHRMRGDSKVSSYLALGPGLALALLPSLLIALAHPVSVRALALGVGGLVVMAVGVQQRWAAPFLAGAVTVALLAIRNLGPVIAGVPRWTSLGVVGVVLLVLGVTWEARARNLRTAARYLRSLV